MKTFPVKKGDVIELGEGNSSTALRDGDAYFTENGVEMIDKETIHALIGRYWDIAYKEGKTGVSHGTEAQEVLSKINLALSPDDTALLREALEGYESMYGRKPERIEKIITALRERLGEVV